MITVAADQGQLSGGFPDMTALLDVIFILLVFLLLTANTVPEVLEVTLPQDSEAQAQSIVMDKQITVALLADGDRWGVGSVEYASWNEFERALLSKIASTQEPEIIMSGDKDVSLEKTLKLFSWLQKHNLTAAQIMMSPSDF